MAITLNDMRDRLVEIENDIIYCDYGHAKTRTANLINLIDYSGIVIHATATVQDKKVESNDN